MSDESKNEEKKKIIVDEDWKSQVEAEKEATRKGQEMPECKETEASSDPTGPMPPPNLTFLASSLYLQGMVALGLLPGPGSDKPQVHLDQAKHGIDTLEMLREKTEGNRTPEESKEMDTMLHELRLAYLAVQEQGGRGKDEG